MEQKSENITSVLEELISDQHDDKNRSMLRDTLSYIYDLEQKYFAKEKEAYTDSLTGIGNRAYLDEKEKSVLSNADKFGYDVSYIVIDIKDFKIYNDLHSQSKGDEKLQYVANSLESELRDSDVVARSGGDEFTVILQNINVEESLNIANRMKKNIKNNYDIDLHMGLANYKETTEYHGQLKAHAEHALECSKKQKSNKPFVYSSSDSCSNGCYSFLDKFMNYAKKHVDAFNSAKKGYMISLSRS